MDKYKAAIAEYEAARVAVRDLDIKRVELIWNCQGPKGSWGMAYRPNSKDAENCLTIAFQELQYIRRESPGEGYSYDEVLNDCDYCQNCVDSYRLKTGPLAEAKHRFGVAKRRLSALGKGLANG